VSLERARGLVCVVSDRHRLLPGRPPDAQLRAIVDQAQAAAASGVDLFQIRERDVTDRALLALATQVLDRVKGSSMRVLINDRLDIALAAGAHGVHLKSSGIPASSARPLAPAGFLIGCSAHTSIEVERGSGGGADFVIFGTIYPTTSKPAGHPWAGEQGLADAARLSGVPVLAIGGIDAARVREVARFASGVAAIGWFATTDVRRLAAAVQQVHSAFDTVKPLI
jgi:thiamine-phosphate pyrophosphorylase